jgi:hypothetical protein
MPLRSQLFAGDAKLQACLTSDAAHLVLGAKGDHVSKVHTALFLADGISVDADELRAKLYGASTAAAVLAYKKKRKIINRSYQSKEDSIVGKMTIASLDDDVMRKEQKIPDFPLTPQDKAFI